nr:MAG TPA: jmjN domain [Caudoviricetes sp.]
MITAEQSAAGINAMLDEYNLSKEEFWKDPEKFLDSIEDKVVRIMIEAAMQLC